ncbi:DNA polymerase I-3'-5' exonuclease and polymerase domain protein [Burkholderia pseudomallei]|nr:DNA polymerase I-3'-5' exonuclease and polymerase domain protein [Burkholderia pseudomallei]
MDRLDLQREIGRHRRAVRLVVGIQIVAEGFALGVEHARAILCTDILAHAAQHIDDSVERSGRLPARAAQIRHRMVSPIQIARTVNQ